MLPAFTPLVPLDASPDRIIAAAQPLAVEQRGDAGSNLVADLAYALDRLSLRVLEGLVLATKALDDRALLAASQGREHLCACGDEKLVYAVILWRITDRRGAAKRPGAS